MDGLIPTGKQIALTELMDYLEKKKEEDSKGRRRVCGHRGVSGNKGNMARI